MSHPITYQTSDGNIGVLSGKATTIPTGSSGAVKSWVDRTHPSRGAWIDAERRMRDSFVATRAALVKYLVPHRFEGRDADPASILRSRYGYGIKLNEAYLHEIMGHVRGAMVSRVWGPLAGAGGDESQPGRPIQDGSIAQRLYDDATRDNVSWPMFFGHVLLEWITSSPGGLVLIDNLSLRVDDASEERVAGKRPFVRFIPWSWVEDFGSGDSGLRWVKIAETVDERQPKDREERGLTRNHVLYELTDNGETEISRWDKRGQQVGPTVRPGKFFDMEDQPTLPLVDARIGQHPDMTWLGAGLLLGLDDIVIDLFNTISEAREGYRDATFGMTTYRGPDEDSVFQAVNSGSRLVALGDAKEAEMTRISGDVAEVSGGLELVKLGIEAWKLGAKRRAQAKGETTAPQSGIALQAQFQLDLVPLLVEVANALDMIETNVMYVAAQVGDRRVTARQLQSVGAVRVKDFRPEDEASRISRIVDEFDPMIHLVPAEAKGEIVARWVEATDVVDMDTPIEVAGTVDPETGEPTDVETMDKAEFIERRAVELAREDEERSRQASELASIGLRPGGLPPEGGGPEGAGQPGGGPEDEEDES